MIYTAIKNFIKQYSAEVQKLKTTTYKYKFFKYLTRN